MTFVCTIRRRGIRTALVSTSGGGFLEISWASGGELLKCNLRTSHLNVLGSIRRTSQEELL